MPKHVTEDSGGNITVSGDLNVNGFVDLEAPPELTISAGVVTATSSHHTIDTEADAATDDLDTINGGDVSKILIIRPNNGDRTIVVKDNTGNMRLAGDFTMNNSVDVLMLVFTGSMWHEISRSNNGP